MDAALQIATILGINMWWAACCPMAQWKISKLCANSEQWNAKFLMVLNSCLKKHHCSYSSNAIYTMYFIGMCMYRWYVLYYR